jgi:hypothetical protein
MRPLKSSEKIIMPKEAQICVEKVCQCFEQNGDDKNIMQHVVAMDIAVAKVSEKKVQTKTDKYFTPME